MHVPKLFPLLHWFQNTFCFLCSSTPSHGGSFFGTMVDLEGENGPKKAKFLNLVIFEPFLHCKIDIFKKVYQHGKELSYRENKMCSETSEAVGTTWEHAQSEIQKFLKIRIPLLCRSSYSRKIAIKLTNSRERPDIVHKLKYISVLYWDCHFVTATLEQV